MNILIPMGGLGHRFAKENYRFPKPLIKIVGRSMLFWLLDHLDINKDDIIYIGVSHSLEKQFHVLQSLQMEYPRRVFQGVILDFETRGAAETLFIMLQSISEDRLNRKTISLDCDTIYFQSILEEFRQLPANINASFYFEDNGGKPIFSYLKFRENTTVEEHCVISEVCEKIMISRHANTGAYAFRSASALKEYCMRILDEAVGHSGEYFTTSIMKLMLEDQERFVGIKVSEENFVCVGTPEQLNKFLKQLKNKETKIACRKMRFCFDLDNTLVSYPINFGDYNSVEPKAENIQLVQELHTAGHYIIIQTARRMKTHAGNIGAVIADIGRVTLETLAKFSIPYDELIFGKPFADIYVDDSAIHALIDTTKEIGWSLDDTVQEWRIPKRVKSFISPRHFNTLQELDNSIIKTSSSDSLQGEIYFYQNIPSGITDLFPKLERIEANEEDRITSIIIEKINGITYSHLFTNMCLTEGRLRKFLFSLKRVHSALPEEAIEPKYDIYANYCRKMSSRYNQYIDVYKSLDDYFRNNCAVPMINSQDLLDILMAYLNQYEQSSRGKHNAIIHGDPVFTNALLTPDSRVVLLDMRGCLGTNITLQGDLNYDLGKVYQSLHGYDFVLLNKCNLISTSKLELYMAQLVKTFEDFISKEYVQSPRLSDLKMIASQLYFTLIPLHTNFQHRIEFYKLAVKLSISELSSI